MATEAWNGAVGGWRRAVWESWGVPGREGAFLGWLIERTPSEWAFIDEQERRWSELEADPPESARSTLANGVRAFARSGYVRQRAVEALADDPHDAVNGFLLVRCDDWVDAVRERARRAVIDRAATGRLDFGRWLPLIVARSARARGRADLVGVIAEAAGWNDCSALLDHPDASARRWALGRVVAGVPTALGLRRLVATARDPHAAAALAEVLADQGDDDALIGLLGDGRAGVRRVAWERVVSGRLPGLDVTAGLRDRSASVRACARRAAQRRGVDPVRVVTGWPRDTAADRRRVLVVLDELGAREVVALAEAWLTDPDPDVRARALGVLAGRLADPGPLLLEWLRVARGRALRAVVRGLVRRGVRVPDEDLAGLRAGSVEQRTAAWRLGRAGGRWHRLLADLIASADVDAAIRAAGRGDLDVWRRVLGPDIGFAPAAMAPLLAAALDAAPADTPALEFVRFVLRG